MGMLGAKSLTGLEALAEALLQDAESGRDACLVSFAGFRVFERHLIDLPYHKQPAGRLV
jgi:hypothetical protein